MNFRDPYLIRAMMEWGFFYFAGYDEGVEGMAGHRMYSWLVLATARAQNRFDTYE